MAQMKKSVLVIQHAAVENIAAIAEPLAEAKVIPQTIELFNGHDIPATLNDHRGLIMMGGPMSVYEQSRYPFIQQEIKLIQGAIAAGKPVLGICLGSQLIATALGARVYPGKKKEIGWYKVRLSQGGRRDPIFVGVPSSFMAFHWHGDIFDLPGDATPLLASDLTGCQGFRSGARTWGLLCHVEVTAESIGNMLLAFPDEIKAAGLNARTILQQTPEYLPALAAIGKNIFTRWTALLT